MKDAEKILSVFTSYENTDKDVILDNVNHYIMPIIGETAESRSDILQFITGKSYGFINTWLHCKTRPVKIPLVDLCKIAVATDCNVFIFFDTEKCSLDEANAKHDAIHDRDYARIYINAFEAQRTSDKDKVLTNLEKYYPPVRYERVEKVKQITGSQVHAIRSWFNRGFRARIPIDKMCLLSLNTGADTDYFDFYS